MRATFFGLELGKRALLATRTGMDVTSQNIANANTEGYTRQRAVMNATDPWAVPGFNSPWGAQQLGTGVEVSKIERMRDQFVDARIRKETTTLEQNTVADDLLKEIEAIFNEPNSATFREQLDKFWSSWQDLSVNPNRMELRANLKEETDALTAMFRDLDTKLRRLQGAADHSFQGSINDQIEESVNQINSYAHQIAQLNIDIEKVETANANANDLRDRRDKLIEDLGKQVNIDVSFDSKGLVTIRNGIHTLVQHDRVRELHIVKKNSEDPGSIAGEESYPEFSDNPAVASGVITHTADQQNITMTVEQTAQAHRMYSFLSFHPLTGPLKNFGVTDGTFTVNGREFVVDAANMTMDNLAKTINDANLGVKATINESGQLIMESRLTGTANGITTANGTSNLFTVLNLHTDRAARDAIFNYGGQNFVRPDNTVTDAIPGAMLFIKNPGVARIDLRPIVTGGRLKSLLTVRDGNVNELRDNLDEMAYRLTTEVNAVHRLGFGLDGKSGRNFFVPIATDDPNQPYKNAAQNIAMSADLAADQRLIGAAGGSINDPNNPLPQYNGDGDGSVAIKIAQVKHGKFFDNGKANFSDFYNKIVTRLATQSQEAETRKETAADLMNQLTAKRQEQSGVSLDEELTNLLKYQQAYNAAAKVITTVDSMLDKVINGMLR